MAALNKLAELNSFVSKFNSLWASGSNASLSIESNAGQAYITLRLSLGDYPGKLNDVNHGAQKKHLSPSKLRRRERRAAERMSAANSKSADLVEKATSCDTEENETDIMNITNIEEDDVVTEKVDKMKRTNIEEVSTQRSCKSSYCMNNTVGKDAILAAPPLEKRSLWAIPCADPRSTKSVDNRLKLDGNQDIDANKKPDCVKS